MWNPAWIVVIRHSLCIQTVCDAGGAQVFERSHVPILDLKLVEQCVRPQIRGGFERRPMCPCHPGAALNPRCHLRESAVAGDTRTSGSIPLRNPVMP